MSAEKPAYPSWRYHPTLGALIVRDRTHEEALGPGWVDSYGKLPDPDAPWKRDRLAPTHEELAANRTRPTPELAAATNGEHTEVLTPEGPRRRPRKPKAVNT